MPSLLIDRAQLGSLCGSNNVQQNAMACLTASLQMSHQDEKTSNLFFFTWVPKILLVPNINPPYSQLIDNLVVYHSQIDLAGLTLQQFKHLACQDWSALLQPGQLAPWQKKQRPQDLYSGRNLLTSDPVSVEGL